MNQNRTGDRDKSGILPPRTQLGSARHAKFVGTIRVGEENVRSQSAGRSVGGRDTPDKSERPLFAEPDQSPLGENRHSQAAETISQEGSSQTRGDCAALSKELARTKRQLEEALEQLEQKDASHETVIRKLVMKHEEDSSQMKAFHAKECQKIRNMHRRAHKKELEEARMKQEEAIMELKATHAKECKRLKISQKKAHKKEVEELKGNCAAMRKELKQTKLQLEKAQERHEKYESVIERMAVKMNKSLSQLEANYVNERQKLENSLVGKDKEVEHVLCASLEDILDEPKLPKEDVDNQDKFSKMKMDHDASIAELKSKHNREREELQRALSKQEAKRKTEISQMKDEHDLKVAKLTTSYDKRYEELQRAWLHNERNYQKELESMKEAHIKYINRVKSAHEMQCQKLQRSLSRGEKEQGEVMARSYEGSSGEIDVENDSQQSHANSKSIVESRSQHQEECRVLKLKILEKDEELKKLTSEKAAIEKRANEEYQAAIGKIVRDYNMLITEVNAANQKEFDDVQRLLADNDKEITKLKALNASQANKWQLTKEAFGKAVKKGR